MSSPRVAPSLWQVFMFVGSVARLVEKMKSEH